VSAVRESACRFGDDRRLAGIFTEPGLRAHRACVLVTAGLLPKHGPFRLYAELARELARDGIASLRFDLGAIGDSAPAAGTRPLRERTQAELAAAVDALVARTGVGDVVAFGLCSGAEDALRYAEHDPRVTAVVMVDPFGYRTAGFAWRHLAYRLSRRALRAAGVYRPLAPRGGGGRRLVEYAYMKRDESARLLRVLVAHGVQVAFVYTGGAHDTFNHAGQLRAMFPELDLGRGVSVDYFPHLDHTPFFAADRDELIAAVRRRLR
jgi:dienelactone hydrolase